MQIRYLEISFLEKQLINIGLHHCHIVAYIAIMARSKTV